MMKIYKKIHKFSAVTTYFSTNKWHFGYGNTKALWKNLTAADQRIFHFSMEDFDWEDYMQKCVAGLRIHVFKDDPSTVPMARKRMTKFLLMHKIIKWASIAFAAWFAYVFFTLLVSVATTSGFSSVTENIVER